MVSSESCVLIGYPSGQEIVRFGSVQKKENCLQRKKVRNFWTWSEMESLKAVEDNQNKGELNDSREFIVLQNSWLSFPFLEINK